MKKNYKSHQLTPFFRNHQMFAALILLLLLPAGGILKAQQTYTFTNAGANGRLGPSQAQVNSDYQLTNLNGSVTVANGIQQFTVPLTGLYSIEAWGAEGAVSINNFRQPGLGARIKGEFSLTAGQVLKILVGQAGSTTYTNNNQFQAGGGGGGSFVWLSTATVPLVVAGGGGGAGAQQGTSFNGVGGATTTAGTASSGSFVSQGGTNGNGGGEGSGNGEHSHGGSAGGGWLTDGASVISAATGGSNIFYAGGAGGINGGVGGQAYGSDGGFGGGGGAVIGGGGGGGYSGGGAGNQPNSGGWFENGGGGGGSYNSGTNQVNTGSINPGHGRVIIAELCNIHIIPSANPICAGTTVTLSTTAVSNYSWSNGSTAASIVVTPSVNTNYSLTGTSSLNCTAGSILSLTVSPGLPVLSVISSTNSTCLGKTATLTASGALTYSWTNGVTNGVSFTPSVTNTYTVSGQNGCGTSTAVTTISVSPLAVTVQNTPTLTCAGLPTTLVATAAATGYTWQPIALFGPTIIVNPSVNTVYTVTVSDGTCSGVAQLSLNTLPVPTINVVSNASLVCAGHPVFMSASGGLSYTWSPGNLSGPSVTVNPSSATLYTVSGENSVGCVTSTTQIVLTDPSPNVNVTASNTLVCSGTVVNLVASGNASAYQWTNGPSGTTHSVIPGVTTVYSVTGSSSNNTCTTTKSIVINVFNPDFTVTPASATVCSGSTVVITALGADSYLWSNGSSGSQLSDTPSTTIVYTVSATSGTINNLNCTSEKTIQVIVNPNPTVTASSSRSVICANESTDMNATGASGYTWSTGQTGSTATVAPQGITIHIFTVTGTDDNGCSSKTTTMIRVASCNGLAETGYGNQYVSVYPNPSSGSIVINSHSEVELWLVNALGQMVEQIRLEPANNYQIGLNGLAPGVYFLTASYGEVLSQKIIITR